MWLYETCWDSRLIHSIKTYLVVKKFLCFKKTIKSNLFYLLVRFIQGVSWLCQCKLTSINAQGGAALLKHFLESVCLCVCVRKCVCMWPLDNHLAAGTGPVRADSSTPLTHQSQSQFSRTVLGRKISNMDTTCLYCCPCTVGSLM